MSNKKATVIFTHSSKTVSPWNTAIKDAEAMIEEAKGRIKTLRSAIRGFEVLRDGGHPWPGSNEAEQLLGRDSERAEGRS